MYLLEKSSRLAAGYVAASIIMYLYNEGEPKKKNAWVRMLKTGPLKSKAFVTTFLDDQTVLRSQSRSAIGRKSLREYFMAAA